MKLFLRLFLSRIIYITTLLQIILCISFAMIQAPNFLNIVRGIKFTFYDLIIILTLRVLEWLNFILFISYVVGLLIAFSGFIKNNFEVFYFQLARPIKNIVKPLFFLSLFYGILFISIDGFFVPYGKVFLKEKMFELYREHFITNIHPNHVISYQDWNFAITGRKNNEQLDGVLLSKQNNPNLTLVINKAIFKNEDHMDLNLQKGVGKIKILEKDFNISFEKGLIEADTDFINLRKNVKYLGLFSLDFNNFEDFYEAFKRTWLFFVALLLAFWIFILFFHKLLYVKYLTSFCMLIMFSMAIEVILFNFFIFFGSAFLILLFYRNTNYRKKYDV